MTEDRYLTTDEVAERLGFSRDSVLRAIKRGHLEALQYGRLVRVPERAVADFIARHTAVA